MAVSLRDATAEDAEVLSAMVEELAHYEGNYGALGATQARLQEQLRSKVPPFSALIVENDGQMAGFAIYFFGYSTWEGARTLHLEDLYVREQFRVSGIGRLIMERLAAIAQSNDCARIEWMVLDGNTQAIGFYERMGARAVRGWTRYRQQLSAQKDKASSRFFVRA